MLNRIVEVAELGEARLVCEQLLQASRGLQLLGRRRLQSLATRGGRGGGGESGGGGRGGRLLLGGLVLVDARAEVERVVAGGGAGGEQPGLDGEQRHGGLRKEAQERAVLLAVEAVHTQDVHDARTHEQQLRLCVHTMTLLLHDMRRDHMYR